MKTTINNVIFNNKKPFEMEHKYVYNMYKESEFTQSESLISNTINLNNSSYIHISIKKNSDYVIGTSDSYLYIEKIDELNTYNKLPSNLNKLFHTPDLVNKNNVSLTLDTNFKSLTKYYNEFITDENLEDLNLSRKISISSDFLNTFKTANKKSAFFSKHDNNSIESIENVFSNTSNSLVDYDLELKEGNFLGNYEVYNRKSISQFINNSYNQNVSSNLENFIGFYIVKYRKEDLNKDFPYEKVCTRFVKAEDSSTDGIQNLFDINVKYSFIYSYYIYPVFSLTIQGYQNNFSYDQVLVCGHPLITEDIEAVEKIKPNYPAGPFFNINKNNLSLEISWNKPLERQEDIKGFQVFRRYNIDEPFTLIKEFLGHLSGDVFRKNQNVSSNVVESTPGEIKYSFIDEDFDTSKVNIYSICSIDAHGLTSDYSTQVGVVYDILLDKIIIDKISAGGAPLSYPNLLIPRKTKYFDNEDSIVSNVPLASKKKKFTIYFTPDTETIRGSEIGTGTYEDKLIGGNSEFDLSIFRLNGQKSILINKNMPKIKINNFSQ